ncbi:MAG: hypothetical protein SGI86_12370 [Deltaproteobacteria bacterium]|nr:hypothetical protein [Deltaproteobacteria bacterium]
MIPPKRKQAYSVFEGAVESGGDPAEAHFLTDLFRLNPEQERSLTHCFHPYAARLHPSIASGAIKRYAGARGRVYDPFCGSGTVLVEAMAAGVAVAGSDASPLAVEIARVRTTPMDGARRKHLIEIADQIADDSAERAMRRTRLEEMPAWARLERPRFEPHVFLELLGLRACIAAVEKIDPEMRRALWMCLSSSLVKWSKEAGPGIKVVAAATKWMSDDGEDAFVRRIGRGVPSRFFARRVRELCDALADLQQVVGKTRPPETAVADARECKGVHDATVSLIVTSPPYAGIYDYLRLHETRYHFTGLDSSKFAAMQIGMPGSHSRTFRRARSAFMAEIARMLRPKAWALLVVGDGVLDSKPENARDDTADAAHEAGLQPVAFASQERRPRDSRLRAVFENTPRREHLLLFRKRP